MAWGWITKSAQRVQELGAAYKQHASTVERLLTLDPAQSAAEVADLWASMDERARAGFRMTVAGLTLAQQGASASPEAATRLERLKQLQAQLESGQPSREASDSPAFGEASITASAARMTQKVAGFAERARPRAAEAIDSARRGLEQHGPAIEAAVKTVLTEIIKAKFGDQASSAPGPTPSASTAASDAPPAQTPVPPPIPTSTQTSIQTPSAAEDERRDTFARLKAELEEEIASGRMTPARAARNRAQMDAVERVLNLRTETITDKRIYLEQMRDALERHYGAMEDVHGEAALAGSRARRVMAFMTRQVSQLIQQRMQDGLASGEQEALEALAMRAMEVVRALDEAADDAAVIELEHALVRQLAVDVRQFERRGHLAILTPVWPSPKVIVEPSGVFCVSSALASTLAPIAEGRRLKVVSPAATGRDPAEYGWTLMRGCTVAVFDLREHAPFDTHGDLARASRVASECYWLGAAYVLGLPVLILAAEGQAVPFDLDVTPVVLSGAPDEDRARLEGAMDEAFYGTQRVGGGLSTDATWDYFLERWATVPEGSTLARQVSEMRAAASNDSIVAAQLLRSAIALLRSENVQVAFPILAPAYPAADSPRCFMVMPFRDHVSGGAALIEAHCAAASVAAIRGDRAEDEHVVRSIWDEIGRATHVTVELTDFNPNVALELGIADALGRKTLLIGQPGTERALFPALAKRRVHVYRREVTVETAGEVGVALTRFLAVGRVPLDPVVPSDPVGRVPLDPPKEPRPSPLAGLWEGQLAGASGTLNVAYRFMPSGRPAFSYQAQGRAVCGEELTHEGQKIQFVPPGGGVVTVIVQKVVGSATETGFVIAHNFERASNGYMTQQYQTIALACRLKGTQLETTYVESGSSYLGDKGGSAGGPSRREFSGVLRRTGD